MRRTKGRKAAGHPNIQRPYKRPDLTSPSPLFILDSRASAVNAPADQVSEHSSVLWFRRRVIECRTMVYTGV
jgi:hypothetical protein